ncbi:hypothetical protein BC829DRAFT_413531 [Chytridium lagenaria]|nr:hypothetical protein BC829DRAFT_413531 [Chytridium lagenaria]
MSAIGTNFSPAVDVDLSVLKDMDLLAASRTEYLYARVSYGFLYPIKIDALETDAGTSTASLTMLLCFGQMQKPKRSAVTTPSKGADLRKSRTAKDADANAGGNDSSFSSKKVPKPEKVETIKSAGASRPSTANRKPGSPQSAQPVKKTSIDGKPGEIFAQDSQPSSPRHSVAAEGRVSSVGGSNMPNETKHLARVPLELIQKIKSLCKSTIVNLKKYQITLDSAFKVICDKEFQMLKELVGVSLCGDQEISSLQVDAPDLDVHTLYACKNLRNGGWPRHGKSVDEAVFWWMQQLVVSSSKTQWRDAR